MLVYTDRVGGIWRLLNPTLVVPRFHGEDLGELFEQIIVAKEFTYKEGMLDDESRPPHTIRPAYMVLLRAVQDFDFSLGAPRDILP